MRTTSLALLLLITACAAPADPGMEDQLLQDQLLESAAVVTEDAALLAGETAPVLVDGDEDPAYAAYSRKRSQALAVELHAVLERTAPQIRAEEEQLQLALNRLERPLGLATRDRHLRNWRRDYLADYRVEVNALYDQAEKRLRAVRDAAMNEAIATARAMAQVRSPLDLGPSGDPLLDRELTAFEEALTQAVDLPDLDAQRQLSVQGMVELLEAFTSFGKSGADEALGGRLMIFVGSGGVADQPQARAVLRLAEGLSPEARQLYQAVRYRVMRGNTVVQDLGWQPMSPSGWLATEVHGDHYLIGSGAAPGINTQAPAFADLRDMRVVVDLQTAVVDGAGSVLGGADWRIEFRVAFRGGVAWQLSDVAPQFNPTCEQVRALLGTS